MLTAEQVSDLIETSMPSIIDGLKEEIKSSITWEVKNQAAKLVAEHVTEWIKTNVLPEITKQLIESRDGLVSLGPELSQQMVPRLTAVLMEKLNEKLTQSWERSKIVEALFK